MIEDEKEIKKDNDSENDNIEEKAAEEIENMEKKIKVKAITSNLETEESFQTLKNEIKESLLDENLTEPKVEQIEVIETPHIEESIQEEEIKENEESEKRNGDFKPVKTEQKKKKIWLILLVSLLAIFLLLFSTIFALINIKNEKIMSGVSIKGMNVSNLTKEEAKKKLEEAIESELKQNIKVKYKEFETSVLPSQGEAQYEIDKAIDDAYNIGRTNNIIKNNYGILTSMLWGKDISPNLICNEEALKQIISEMAKKIPGAVEEGTYSIEDDHLIITKGKAGIAIKEVELLGLIKEVIKKPTEEYIEIPAEYTLPKDINIDEIYAQVCTEPKDAYYETSPFKIYPHVVGVKFKITLEEARQLLEEDKEEYIIELEYTMPAKTTNMIGTEAFPDLISTFSTKYDVSNVNRTQNLSLAASKINGTILMPGEVFSYNKVVGKRTVEAGYKEAAMYEGGKVVDGLGGGICQISSTLYNTALLANLEIVQRSNHQFVTSYLGAGRDATVVYGAIDFRFKNTRQYPVKIICKVKDGIAEIQMYGIKEEKEYVVEIETKITGTIGYTTKYEENADLDIGVEKVVQKGAPGYTSTAYRILKLNGVEVSRTLLSNDTYNAMQRIISKGTRGEKVVETTPEPEVIVTPTPTPTLPPTPTPSATPVSTPTPTP